MVQPMFKPLLTPSIPAGDWSPWSRVVGAALLLAGLGACSVTPQRPQPRQAPPVLVQPPAPVPVPAPAQPTQAQLVAFKAVLRGSDVVPTADTLAEGELVAVFNRESNLLQWRLSFSQLSGPVRQGNFHSPAMSGEVAAPVLAIGRNFVSPYEGRAVLNPRQRDNLLAGQWYVNLRTDRFPDGELRGQMIEQR